MKERQAHALAERLVLVSVQLIRRLRAQDTQPMLSGPQASALAVVVHSGGLTLGELAGIEQVGPSAISKVAKQLEAAGWVTRTPDSQDRRTQRLQATRAGKALLARGQARHTKPLARQISALAAEDTRVLEATIAIIERLNASGRRR